MMHNFKQKILSAIVAIIMTVSMLSTITVMAEREYAADLSINGATLDFVNEPYSVYGMVFVPLEELCGYLKLDLSREGDTYTLRRVDNVLTMKVADLVAKLNGKNIFLSSPLMEKGGVVYAPVEIFSAGFKIPVTISEDKKTADMTPNVYSIFIDEAHAAGISAAVPDKDTIVTGDSESDALFYNNNENPHPEMEKSIYYMIDFAHYKTMDIRSISLTVNNALNSNSYSTLSVMRTALWEKEKICYNNQPEEFSNQKTAEKNLGNQRKIYFSTTFDITTMAKNAITGEGALSLKLLGKPYKTSADPTQVLVKGVNTPDRPYVQITTNETYNFPVKKVETESIDGNRFDEFQILRSLGVFTEEDEFPLDLKESVTRGEFLTYAMRLRGKNIPVGSSEQFFSDVPTDNGYFAVTSSAYELGYISGWQGIAFRPYDAITVGEAVTILGRMLNYDVYADQRGGFTPGYFQAARHGDLYVGVNDSATQLSFKQMFKLLEDALDAKMLNVYSYSSDGEAQYTFDENMTILTEFWNAEKIEGTITANEYSNIVPDGAYSEGYVTIKTTSGAEKKLRLNYEPYNSLLGYKVKGYYEKHENVLLYIGTMDSDVDEYSYNDIQSFSIGASNISFSYKKGNGSLRTESFSKSANVIYNGKSVDASKLELSHLDTGSGKITIVGNNLVIIEAYRPVIVASVNVEEETVYDLYEAYKNILFMKNKVWQITDTDGKEIKLEELKKYDVLSAAVSFDKELYKCILSRKTLSGKIEALEDSGSDGEILTINGIEYTAINKNSGDWEKYLTLNSSGTFLLNHEGLIVGMSVTPNEEILGYVVAMDYSGGSSIRKNLQAALMVTGSEKYVVYDLASTVKIDGKKYTDHEKIKKNTQLFPDGENNPVKMQGIIFSLNNEGKINVIDTVARPENIDNEETTLFAAHTPSTPAAQFNALTSSSSKRTAGGLDYKDHTPGKISDKFFLNMGEALCVVIPTEADNVTPVTDFEEFMTITSGISNDAVINPIVYTIGNNTPNASIVVLEGYNTGAAPTSYYLVVDKVVTAFDSDGIEVKKIYYYSEPDKRESVVVPSDMEALLTGSTVIDGSIKRGDIIRIGKNIKGELSAITEYYDYNKKIFDNLSTSFTAENRLYGGKAAGISDEFVKISLDTDTYPDATDTKTFWVDMNEGFNFYKYTVSSTGVEVLPATIADIRPAENTPDSPTGMLLQARYAQLSNRTAFQVDINPPAGSGIYELSYDPNLPEDADPQTLLGFPIASTRYNPGEIAKAALKGSISVKDYDFDGWINKATGEEIAPGGDVVINDNTILQAKWSPNPSITLTFKYEGMSFETYPSQYVAGTNTPSTLTFPTNADAKTKGLVRPGYEIIGWKAVGGTEEYMLNDKTPEQYNVPAEPTTYEPIWMQRWSGTAAAEAPEKDNNGYYKIYNGEDLAKFAQLVNDGETTANAKLMNDIYLNNFLDDEGIPVSSMDDWYDNSDNVSAAKDWTSYMMKGYAGTFDGDGHSIYGMYISTTDRNGTGLFATLAGTVKNVKVLCGYIKTGSTVATTANCAGMLVGKATAAVTIDNVITSGKITAFSDTNCYINNSAGILANNTSAAGTIITNCESRVDIISIGKETAVNTDTKSPHESNVAVGGIVGLTNKSITITSCKNYGEINVPKTGIVGGILGDAKGSSTAVTITTCENYGAITAYNYAGQIAGYIQKGNPNAAADLNADTSICKGTLTITKPAD